MGKYKKFISIVGLLFCGLLAVAQPPNVLFILVDDLGWRDLVEH